MAVYAPGDDYGGAGSSGAAADPGMLQRILAYLNPIQPAAADTIHANNPLNSPSPVDPRLANGGPPIPPGLMSAAQQPPAPLGDPPPSVGGSSGGAGASNHMPWPPPPAQMGPPQSATPWFHGGNNPLPWQGPAPMPPVRPKGLGKAPVRIPASATASVPPAAAAANPLFTPVAAQNQDWSGGALSRYGTSGFGRQGTALDLSKLFSRS